MEEKYEIKKIEPEKANICTPSQKITNIQQGVPPEEVDVQLKRKLYEYKVNYKTPAEKGEASLLDPNLLKKSQGEILSLMMTSLEASEEFYTKKNKQEGQGYAIVKKLIKKYRDNKWIRMNRSVRFPTPLGGNVIFKDTQVGDRNVIVAQVCDPDNGKIKEMTISQLKGEFERRKKNSSEETSYGLSLADIYYLTDIADGTDWATKALQDYLYSYRPGLESILTFMIEITVETLMDSEIKRLARYGKLIYTIYMKPSNEDRKIEDLIAELGYSERRTYYRQHDEAIELIGKKLFGLEPGEFGLADIVMKDGRYVFADAALYNPGRKKEKRENVKEDDDIKSKKFFTEK